MLGALNASGLIRLDRDEPGWFRILRLIVVIPEKHDQAGLRRWFALNFPQIDPTRLRAADLIRIPLQALWLLIVVTDTPAQPGRAATRQSFIALAGIVPAQGLDWLKRQLARLDAWSDPALHKASVSASARFGAQLARRLAATRLDRRASLAGGLLLGLAIISTPTGSAGQTAVALLLLACALPVWRMPADLRVSFIGSMSLLVSLRYLGWRLTVCLPQELPALLVSALLLVAEIFIATSRLWRGMRPTVGYLESSAPAGFFQATMQLSLLLVPALAVACNYDIFPVSMAEMLPYLLPHLVLLSLADSAQGAYLRPVPRTRATLDVARVLPEMADGDAARLQRRLAAAAIFCLMALFACSLRLLGDSGADLSDSLPILLVWTLHSLMLLAVAASRADQQGEFSGQWATLPDEVLRGSTRMRQSLADPLRPAGRRLLQHLKTLRWWLPHWPQAAYRPAVFMVMLAMSGVLSLAAPNADAATRKKVAAKPAASRALANKASPVAAKSATLADPEIVKEFTPQTRRHALKQLTGLNTLQLRTTDGSASAYFGSRADELVTGVTLTLTYTYSPALLPRDSHIKILLNDEVIGVAQVTEDKAGRPVTQVFDIDPRFVTETNHLKFQFVGHYAKTCEDPLHTGLWASISGASEIAITYTQLSLEDELADLPAPFFDRRDLRQLVLPFVYSPRPAMTTIQASAIVSSWFGKLAGERGARFPSHMDELPPGHGVVIATNSDRPAFLLGHPKVDKPTIEIMTNPADGRSKLLLVLGRDGNDINQAAASLVLGHPAMSGNEVKVTSRNDQAARQAYDAPNWIRPDRPTRLGELIDFPQQLQVVGHSPRPIRLKLKMPPDLYSVRGKGAPLDLRYRYSPPVRTGESRLTVTLNEELLQSLSLTARPLEGKKQPMVGLPDEALLVERRRLMLPDYKLNGSNRLQFNFNFSRYQEGPCPDTPPDETVRALIDADSTVDFSGYYHFARMPNLNYFATVGFPFTKYADLSQTVMVLPENPNPQEIEAAVTLVGFLSQSTGVPATRLRIAGTKDETLLRDADLLVVGSAINEGLLANWNDVLPATVSGEVRKISQPAQLGNYLYDWLGFGVTPDSSVLTQEKLTGTGPLSLLLGFQSPFTPGRSVVVVTASAPEQLRTATDALGNPDLLHKINGSAAYIQGSRVSSYLVGDTYFIGDLPWWVTVWIPLASQPVVLAFLSVFAALLLGYGLWRWRGSEMEETEE